jgi:hypothetical protein
MRCGQPPTVAITATKTGRAHERLADDTGVSTPQPLPRRAKTKMVPRGRAGKGKRGRVLETPVRGPLFTVRTAAGIDASNTPWLLERPPFSGTRRFLI